MEKQEFIEKFYKSLKEGDISSFQKTLYSKMKEYYGKKLKELEEQMSDIETEAVTKIQIAAKEHGAADNFLYEQGVAIVTIPNKQAAIDFSDWLEECEYVDSYDIEAVYKNPVTGYDEKGEYDIDQISDDTHFEFEFTIFLDPSIVQFDPYVYDDEEEQDEEEYDEEEQDEKSVEVNESEEIIESVEQLDEVTRKIKVDFRGQKRIKMKCARGFKWNPNTGACEKISGEELAKMRKSIRKALITKKAEGSAFRLRVVRKMRKAFRYRKQMGLKV